VLRLLMLACLLAAGAGVAAVAGLPAPPERAAALQPPRPIPARMLGPGVPVPISPALLRVRNAWLVSDGRTLVAVYAGADGEDPSVGRLVIVRQDLRAGNQTVRTIDAGPTGALTIAAAPLGSSVETSAQTGKIRLRAADGGALTLDLGPSTLTRAS
jgi:hypothetical protein